MRLRIESHIFDIRLLTRLINFLITKSHLSPETWMKKSLHTCLFPEVQWSATATGIANVICHIRGIVVSANKSIRIEHGCIDSAREIGLAYLTDCHDSHVLRYILLELNQFTWMYMDLGGFQWCMGFGCRAGCREDSCHDWTASPSLPTEEHASYTGSCAFVAVIVKIWIL